MRVWTSVKAISGHQRAATADHGAQAGVVVNDDNLAGGEVDVKWDTDGVTETVLIAELQALN